MKRAKRKTIARRSRSQSRKAGVKSPAAEVLALEEQTPVVSSTKKPKRFVQRKTRAAGMARTVRKRVIRKPRAKASSRPVASEPPVLPAVATPGQEAEAAPAEQVAVSGITGAEPSGEETTPAEAGVSIPQILLEGDEPVAPPTTGPGQKYALGPTTLARPPGPEEAVLPESYGTGTLWLAARDPHWLYAHWDLASQQQRRYNALSADRHLVVRVFRDVVGAQPVKEVHVHPESRHWFIHTERADARHVAELGYYRPGRQWVTIATSGPAVTPPDTVSNDQTVRFATIPAQVRLAELAALAKPAIPADSPPADASRERALAELVTLHLMRRDLGSSAAITELIQGRSKLQVSVAPEALAVPLGGEAERASSPPGVVEQRPKGFWFSVNTELVIYGATEPGASVTIGGRPISLRPDGTFSWRFSLPEGDHAVTVSALSAAGELRQAELHFRRRTEHRGEVGAAPQDPSLEPAVETPQAD